MSMVRYLFDSPQAAAQGLLTTLQYARNSQDVFTFGGLTLKSVTDSGLWLNGSFDGLLPLLDKIPGALRQGAEAAN